MIAFLTIICIIQLIIIGWLILNWPIISVKKALEKMKDNLIKLIIFYQGNYNDSDQIVLIKKWLDSIDFEKVEKEQLKLFKEFVNCL